MGSGSIPKLGMVMVSMAENNPWLISALNLKVSEVSNNSTLNSASASLGIFSL